MNKFFSMSILSTAALAGLASIALTEPAAARMTSCQIKHSYCSERCIMNYNGGSVGACIQRTCNRQHPGCGPDSIGRGRRFGLVANPTQPGPVASGPQSPRSPVNQGPFPPGGAQPKNGGIVSGGMPKNGGIVPSGPVRMFSQGRR